MGHWIAAVTREPHRPETKLVEGRLKSLQQAAIIPLVEKDLRPGVATCHGVVVAPGNWMRSARAIATV